MTGKAPRPLSLGLGLGMFAAAMLAIAPVAEAQFFWSPWFQEPKRPKVRPVKPKAPGDDLPPIVPKESSAPPPPDDRPYDQKLLRLTEILGAVHYLRELCGAQEGQLWRNQMKDILKNEGSTAVRRAKLVNSFNDGYRGYRRTYRSCTSSATLAITRFSTEGAQIAVALANPSSAYASRNAPAQAPAAEGAAGEAAPAPAQAAPAPNAGAPAQNEANANPNAAAGQPAPAAPAPATDAGQAAPATTGTTSAQPQAASTGQTEINPDAADQAEQPRKKKKKAQRKPPEAAGTIPFFSRR
jgi:uncharacterized protein (TIGR02301 family)